MELPKYSNLHLSKKEKIDLEEMYIITLEQKLQSTPDDERLKECLEAAKNELTELTK